MELSVRQNRPKMKIRIIDRYPSNTRRVLRLYHAVPPDWLDAVLRHRYLAMGHRVYVDIKSLLYVEGGRRRNQEMSDMIAVTVDAEINGRPTTHHLMVKLLPIRPCCRYFVVQSDLDLREIRFYTEIVKDLMEFQRQCIRNPNDYVKLPVAKCYYARYTPVEERLRRGATMDTTEESVLVLENLLYLNYYTGDCKKGLSAHVVEFGTESLAIMHAITLAMKVVTNTPINERYNFLYSTDHRSNCFEELIHKGYPKLIRFLRTREGSGHIIRGLYKIKSDVKYLMEALLTPEEPMSVLTHTDFRANNLMFSDTDCVILDWRLIACGRPTNDLALLLATSVRAAVRRRYTQRILDHYWRHFVEYTRRFGVDIERDLGYNRERLSQDYRRSLVLAALLCIGSIDLILGNPITEDRFYALLEDLSRDNLLAMNIVPIHYFNF